MLSGGHDAAFWEAVLRGGAIGVVGSVTAALVFTMMPVGCLGAAIHAGVVSGVFGGGAAQVTANVLDGRPTPPLVLDLHSAPKHSIISPLLW